MDEPPDSLRDERSRSLVRDEGREDLVGGEDLKHESRSRDGDAVGEDDEASLGNDGVGTSSTEKGEGGRTKLDRVDNESRAEKIKGLTLRRSP